MRTWAVLAMAISLAPVGVWIATRLNDRRENAENAEFRESGEEPALTTGAVAPVSGTPTGGN